MFSFHTTPLEFENETITGRFGFVFEENSVISDKSHVYHDVIVFEKLHFHTVFCLHKNAKPAFSNKASSVVWTAQFPLLT